MQADDQARIAQLQAELDALRAEMQDFTYTVSHDLRASLRHVVSYVNLVQEDAGEQLDAEVRGFLQTATDSARHMGLLMDGLVDLARLGTVALEPACLPLQAMVHEAVAAVQAQYPQRQIVWRIAPDVPDVVADAVQLRAAIGHVLDNAVKFTELQPHAEIMVSARTGCGAGTGASAESDAANTAGSETTHVPGASTSTWVELTVRDNGAGFNPAHQAKLFHPLQRLHSVRQFAGLGMGLALTRKILTRMGGSVRIEGAPEAGCSVYLTLPAA